MNQIHSHLREDTGSSRADALVVPQPIAPGRPIAGRGERRLRAAHENRSLRWSRMTVSGVPARDARGQVFRSNAGNGSTGPVANSPFAHVYHLPDLSGDIHVVEPLKLLNAGRGGHVDFCQPVVDDVYADKDLPLFAQQWSDRGADLMVSIRKRNL